MKRLGVYFLFATALAWSLPSGAAPSTLERVGTQKEITVCADPDNMPFSSAQGSVHGFEMDIAAEVASRLGAKLNVLWFASNFGQRLLKQVAEGHCDFVMGLPAIPSFAESVPRLSLTKSYYSGGFALMVPRASKVETLADLGSKPVGVEMATVPDVVLAEEGISRKLYRTPGQLFDAITSGEVEAGIITAAAGGWLGKSRGDAAVRIIPRTRERFLFKIAMGVRKDDQALKEAIDAIVSDMESSGRLDQILSLYGIVQLTAEGSHRELPHDPPAQRKSEAPSSSLLVLTQSDKASIQTAAVADATADPARVEAGRKLYKQACYKCHGENGISGGIVPDVRKFKDKGDDAEFLKLVRDGRAGTAMPPWKEILNDDEIMEIIAYVRSLPVN